MVIPAMNDSKILQVTVKSLKAILNVINWACFSIFIYGIVFVVVPFLVDYYLELDIFEISGPIRSIYPVLMGVGILSGWLATFIVAPSVFVIVTVMWLFGQAPWYWRSLVPLNFSFVILVAAFFSDGPDKSLVSLVIPLLIVVCSAVIAWILVAHKVHERKLLVLLAYLVVPGMFIMPPSDYMVPLFLGMLLLCVSVFAKLEFRGLFPPRLRIPFRFPRQRTAG